MQSWALQQRWGRLSKAARPGLERLLEARKRLQQLEEEKATGSDPGELHPRKLIWFT